MVKIELNVKYRLLNLEAGTYLTVSSKDNVSIVGQQYINGSNQMWMFEATGQDKVYFIKSMEGNKYFAVPSGQVVEGEHLEARSLGFEWLVVDEPHMGIAVRIKPTKNTGLCVDLYEAHPDDGTPVQLWSYKGNNQIWVLEKER